jgi:hypothetical protein
MVEIKLRGALKKAFHRAFAALAVGLWCSTSWATHLVGGEIYYTHLGGSQYLVTLKVYRDCGPANSLGTDFDDQVYIGMWDGTGDINNNDVLTIPLTSSNVSNVPVVFGESLRHTSAGTVH